MLIELRKDVRPYFDIKIGDNLVFALLDTGAKFSVYTKDTETLFRKFPNVTPVGCSAYISGFGGKINKSQVYLFPEVCIGDITYHNVPFACVPNNIITAEFILASNILATSPFTIDYASCTMTIDKLRDNVWCNFIAERRANEKENVWKHTSVFVQQ